ncbi:MAG: CarD family transcriptional regulator [Gracilibacteraceae bacterium]|jgi:CarD family transcriptional regulator|nr:CarD family transcriptional regulator [Gracilibacteraceae bacterium]
MMPYQVGESVLYGIHGVCRIEGVEDKLIDGNSVTYYVLNPIFESGSTIYTPVDSEKTKAKMRPLLSAPEIFRLIRSMPGENMIWLENENENDRKNRYREIIAGGDRTELIRLIKTLYFQKQTRAETGKKPLASDNHFMKDAEKVLYDEFAHVLNIKREEIVPFIREQIEYKGG